MRGNLTSLRREPKPVVLWTPWGAIPKAGFHGRQAKGWATLPNAIDPQRPRPAGADKLRKPS